MGAFILRDGRALGWAPTSMARVNFGDGSTRRVSGDRMREDAERMDIFLFNAPGR